MPVRLTGRLICRDETEAATVRAALPEHVRLTCAEPGCIEFHVTETENPLVWDVAERFTDRAAFDAHQNRTKGSAWFRATSAIPREYTVKDEA